MTSLKLITQSEVYENVNHSLEQRRLNLYSIDSLLEIYSYEKNKLFKPYSQLVKFYPNISLVSYYDANRYVPDRKNFGQPIKKETLIEMIIIFYETRYLIFAYLKQIKENET